MEYPKKWKEAVEAFFFYGEEIDTECDFITCNSCALYGVARGGCCVSAKNTINDSNEVVDEYMLELKLKHMGL